MTEFLDKHFGKIFLSLLVLRYIILYTNNLNLYADEAQYYYWSQNLDFGYYSKPPLISLIIALSTKIFGTNEFGVRFFAPLFHALTALIMKQIAGEFYSKKLAKTIAIAYLAIPALALSSIIISTDVLLLTFWSLSIYLFLKVINSSQKLPVTILLGISLGLGMLSKYNMFLFWVGGFVYLIYTKKLKENFWYCAIASFAALIIFSPNFYWNFANDFVSFRHTKDISKLDHSSFNIPKLIEFLAGQFALIGPVLLCIIIKSARKYKDPLFMISAAGILPFIILSLTSGANINWASVAYPGLLVLGIASYQGRFLNAAILTNIVLSFVVITLAHVNFTNFDPLYRTKGWDHYGDVITETYYENKAENVLIDERKLLSWALYYTKLPNSVIYKISDYKDIKDHYDLTKRFEGYHNNSLIVTKDCNKNYGKLVKRFKPLESVNKSPDICLYFYE
ncbi:MAG: glycosyltransferase family 39 protein [Alphaproteobacteria bacterium]|nr:glycosyltransferase family 39 protein [Alphaproteobacteria bacterium]OJV13125.1 MAG: hypothetical protein BGO27_02740 [Alphaproteobacteria bacterium 33-17]